VGDLAGFLKFSVFPLVLPRDTDPRLGSGALYLTSEDLPSEHPFFPDPETEEHGSRLTLVVHLSSTFSCSGCLCSYLDTWPGCVDCGKHAKRSVQIFLPPFLLPSAPPLATSAPSSGGWAGRTFSSFYPTPINPRPGGFLLNFGAHGRILRPHSHTSAPLLP